MKGLIIFMLVNVLNFAVSAIIFLTVEDKNDQKAIGSVFAFTAATVHVLYLCYYYGLDWIP